MTPDNPLSPYERTAEEPSMKQGELVEKVALAMLKAHFRQNGVAEPTELGPFDGQYREDARTAIEASGLAELEEANRVLTRELASAAGIFRAYEALHLEKRTPDGNEKAKRNAGFAESIERTLAALTPSGEQP